MTTTSGKFRKIRTQSWGHVVDVIEILNRHSQETICSLWDDSLTHSAITWNISSFLNHLEYLNIKKKKQTRKKHSFK